jgi:hypothetical protein
MYTNDIFCYQDSPKPNLTNDTNTKTSLTISETPITPSVVNNIEFFNNTITEKKEEKDELNISSTTNITTSVTPVVKQT